MKLKSQNISWPQVIITLFLALALFGSTFTWFTTQRIETNYVETQNRINTMNDLIDDILSYLESGSSSN